jgi:hypothetical protein
MEQIEEFIFWKGAFELAYLLQNTDDAPYKYEVYDILKFCFDLDYIICLEGMVAWYVLVTPAPRKPGDRTQKKPKE